MVLNEARACLQAIDAVLSESALDDEAFASYVKLNEQFHALLSELSGSSVIAVVVTDEAHNPVAMNVLDEIGRAHV